MVIKLKESKIHFEESRSAVKEAFVKKGSKFFGDDGRSLTVKEIYYNTDAFDKTQEVVVVYEFNLPDGTRGTEKVYLDKFKTMVKDLTVDDSSKSLNEGVFDYDEDSEDDRALYDMIGQFIAEEFCPKFGLDIDEISQYSRYLEVVESLIHIVKQSRSK